MASRHGTQGKLVFGHDQGDKPFTYWGAIFAARGRLFVLEAGGAGEAFERARPSVEWMLKSLRVRCESVLSPILASRTCNRW